jgi:ribosomal protein S18 acetylase RimI-like enzyme
MMPITLRPATAEDENFLFDLYCAVRGAEFALLPLPSEQKQQLIRMQYQAQQSAYQTQFPQSGYEVVMRGEQPVGRVWIARLQNELHLVDIAVMPDAGNTGIGTFLVRQLQEEARGAGKPIRSTVFRFNPGSLRFHQRLGFVVISEDEMQFQMEWQPS